MWTGIKILVEAQEGLDKAKTMDVRPRLGLVGWEEYLVWKG